MMRIVLLFFLCSCTVQQPSAGNLYTYRHHATGHAIQNENERMTHYYDTPAGIWYDENHNRWRYDENGWYKIK